MALGFRAVERDQPFLLPPDLRDWLPEDHLARFVVEIVEQLDLSELEAGYRLGRQGRAAYDPSGLPPVGRTPVYAARRDGRAWV